MKKLDLSPLSFSQVRRLKEQVDSEFDRRLALLENAGEIGACKFVSRSPVSWRVIEKQDWSNLFAEGDSERRYYVYAHLNPSQRSKLPNSNADYPPGITGLPFYIGKGTGSRAYDLNRNQGHGARLKSLLSAGLRPDEVVCILRRDMTEREALVYESKLIYYFGTRYETGRRGVLVNLDIPPRPEGLGFSPTQRLPQSLHNAN